MSKPIDEPSIESRKEDHLDLCAGERVAFRGKSTLLEEVELIHCALPEMSIDEIDTSVEWGGKRLSAPLVIAAMTGGVERAAEVNRDLAALAEEMGLGFGFGSMRPLLSDNNAPGYAVRDVAPGALLIGNIGVVQARESSTEVIEQLIATTGVDLLAIHLNPAMEVVQVEGDRDFRGGLETVERYHRELSIPIVVKETGCGLSGEVGHRLREIGVEWVDCSGAGGTSWVGVEALRERADSAGEAFWDWGIPTAASVAQLSGLGLGICATGGVKSGLDIARAIALGATCGGIARPVLQAWTRGGVDGARSYLQRVLRELRIAMLLSGCRNVEELQERRVHLGPNLRRWVLPGSPLAESL